MRGARGDGERVRRVGIRRIMKGRWRRKSDVDG